jgi:hypothetical protein
MSESDLVIDADKLAVALAERLAAIVPDGFDVRAMDGTLWYSFYADRFPGHYRGGGSGTSVVATFDDYEEESPSDRIVYIAKRALDDLQDVIDESSHEPWPGTVRPPSPHAQIRGDMLHLWYGSPEITDEPVLACEPIPLTSLRP